MDKKSRYSVNERNWLAEGGENKDKFLSLSRAVEQSHASIIITDTEGTIQYVNPYFTEVTGYGREEVIGQNPRILKAGKQTKEVYEKLWRTIKAGKNWRGEFCNKKKSGELYWERVSISPVENSAGRITNFVAVKEDFTEYKRTQETLELERAKLKSILDNMQDGVNIVNQDHEIEYVNPALEKIFGALKGQKCHEYLHNFKKPCPNCNLGQIGAGESVSQEWYYPKTRKTYEFFAVPLLNGKGRPCKLQIFHDISERKKAEKDLQSSLKRYQSFIEVTGQLGWNADAAGEVVEDMPAWRKFTGQSAEEIKGWGWSYAVHPDDLERVTIAWVNAVKAKSGYEIRYRLRRHDGVYRYFMSRGVPLFNNDGNVKEWIGTSIDITERELLEKRMEHLSSFPRLNPNPVIESDAEGNVMFFNSATLDLLKRLEIEYNVSIFLPDNLPEIFKAMKLSGRTKIFRREVRIKERIFLENIFLPENLNVVRFYIFDITELKNSEERLKQEHKIIDTLIENTNTSLVYFDADFNYVWANSAYAAFSGLDAARLAGKNHFELFPNKENQALFGQAKANGEIIKVKARTADFPGKPELGVSYWDWQLTPVKDFGGHVRGFVYSMVDVTESKNAEEEKNNFIAVMSHELRNPLAPILTSAQLIKTYVKDSGGENKTKALSEAAGVIEKQARIMARLLDDLLDVARLNQGKIKLKKEPLNLAESLAGAIKAAEKLVQAKKQKLIVILPPWPVYLKADQIRLEQIATNLLSNANKYTPDGGQICFEIRQQSDFAEIRVRDNGLGMDRAKLGSIFSLFRKTAGSYISSPDELGIGLKLTKDLVAAHGGIISAESRGVSKGSEFIVKLPALAADYSPENLKKQAAPAAPGKTRLLIIDDNKDIADMQAELFNFYGYETKVVYDGPAALALARDYKPQAALVDIGMPVMDGYEVAREFKKMERRIKQKIKLIAATGYGQDEDKRRSREAGFDYHFVKPVDFDALLKALEEV